MKNPMGSIKFGKEGKEVNYSGERIPQPKSQQQKSSANPVAQLFNALLNETKEAVSLLKEGVQIKLPDNVAAPIDSDSVDLRRLVLVESNTNSEVIFRFQAPKGTNVLITNYGVFTDILSGQEFKVTPKVNGSRILQYHGDPNLDFAINLSLGPDLTDDSLVPCQIHLRPNDILTWEASNLSANAAPIGVRIKGHVDKSGGNRTGNFGG